jgi:hypothetical protein
LIPHVTVMLVDILPDAVDDSGNGNLSPAVHGIGGVVAGGVGGGVGVGGGDDGAAAVATVVHTSSRTNALVKAVNVRLKALHHPMPPANDGDGGGGGGGVVHIPLYSYVDFMHRLFVHLLVAFDNCTRSPLSITYEL